MELAILGLGRMGGNMVRRLRRDDHRVIAWNRSPEPVKEAEGEGAIGAYSLDDVVNQLSTPRVVWMMVPHGDPVDKMIEDLLPRLDEGDILIDGGNSNWQKSVERAEKVRARNVNYMDIGVSGGIWGLEIGYCLMIGGDEASFQHCEPAFRTLAPENGYKLVGRNGAGHFAKMIHNGIEYGMMQAYAEGFELMDASPYEFDLKEISDLWNSGSVVRSWLLELAGRAYAEDPNMEAIQGYVEDSGEGRWTIEQAINTAVPAPVLTLALMMRFRSRQEDSYSARVVAALRKEFGGHSVKSSSG
jgi:6-phosphogluconate dehydrogenase